MFDVRRVSKIRCVVESQGVGLRSQVGKERVVWGEESFKFLIFLDFIVQKGLEFLNGLGLDFFLLIL